jgi:hypothetical protein
LHRRVFKWNSIGEISQGRGLFQNQYLFIDGKIIFWGLLGQ